MTRFARAKGSKASNERVPNEATPWHVMKEQLLQNSGHSKEHQGRTKSAKELLKEKDDLIYYDNIGNVNTDWAEFEETSSKKKVFKNNGDLGTSDSEKKRKLHQTTDRTEELKEDTGQHDTLIKKRKLSLSSNSGKLQKDKNVINTENNIVTEEKQLPRKFNQKQEVIESALNKSLKGRENPDIKDRNKVSKSGNNVDQCESKENENESLKRTPKKKIIEIDSNEYLDNSKSIDINNKNNVSKLKNNVSQCKSIKSESKVVKTVSKKKKKNVHVSKTDNDNAKTNGTKGKIEDDVSSTSQKQTEDTENSIALSSNMSESTRKDNKTSHVKLSKRQKRNLKHKKNNSNENHSKNSENFNADGNDWSNSVQFGKNSGIHQVEDTKKGNDNDNTNEKSNDSQEIRIKSNDRTENFKQKNINNRPAIKRKAPKIRDDKEHKRRKPVPASRKIIINGVEIEIVMFDGFPVKKEDAERLKDLKQKMIMKGIPKSEIAAAMKLERRKAEKALARVKKFVCYHCRKSGHNLSDCPELGAEQAGTGICFKCGSTEHTHFECKVTKGAEYRHATCFICREQGHLAKQCPDNPKGVYPQGGACKICGDVTHLKKDCPDLAQQKEDAAITVHTIANSNLESLEEEATKTDQISDKKNLSTKIVKF